VCLGVRARELYSATPRRALICILCSFHSQVARKLLGAVGTKVSVTFRRGPVHRAHKHMHGQKSAPNARTHNTRKRGQKASDMCQSRGSAGSTVSKHSTYQPCQNIPHINRVKIFHISSVMYAPAYALDIFSRGSYVTQETQPPCFPDAHTYATLAGRRDRRGNYGGARKTSDRR
jgi:hypothetical protein